MFDQVELSFFSKKLHSAGNEETIPVNNRSWGEELGAVLRAIPDLREGKATLDRKGCVKHWWKMMPGVFLPQHAGGFGEKEKKKK